MNTVTEPSAQSKCLATLAAVVLTIGLGFIDYITGREWAISAFYLLPTCLAAWLAGRWAGFAVGALCTSAWFVADMLSGAAYQHPLIPVWNALMLFAFFIVVVWLLTAFRRSHYHLEQMVERRTTALRAEIDKRKRLEQAKLQAERLAIVGSMAAQVAHALLDQKHVELRKNLNPELPAVQGDPDQIWEVVLNLIRNAVDAMPGGGNLTVSTQADGAKALLSISDSGRGMTEEEARNLFVPFFTTKSDGTGLGLAYAQQVISEHGGRIDCATVRGKGSTFSIQLPLAVAA